MDSVIMNAATLEDFCKQTGFREFYKQNKPYYDSLIREYKTMNPIGQMKNWLEAKFDMRYGSYVVYLSPLVGGFHFTQKFEEGNLRQIAMYVSTANISGKRSRYLNEMVNSRMVFTEIDHNFVNPVSAELSDRVDKAFATRSLWVRDSGIGTGGFYSGATEVFNEYMTWAVFSLYCLDNYPRQEVEAFLPIMEKQMMEKRNFIQFGPFNRTLIALYESGKPLTMRELFDQILLWCAQQHK